MARQLTGDEGPSVQGSTDQLSQMNLNESTASLSRPQPQKDVFDVMFEPQNEAKRNQVTKLLHTFVNQHLAVFDRKVQTLESDFRSGVLLLLLVGKLANFFVPLARFYPQPENEQERLHNILLAFRLLRQTGLVADKWNERLFLKGDVKMTFRVLYDLCQAFPKVEQ